MEQSNNKDKEHLLDLWEDAANDPEADREFLQTIIKTAIAMIKLQRHRMRNAKNESSESQETE